MKELTLSSVLNDFYSYKTSDMYTAIPCRVTTVRVGLEDQRLDIQPLTNKSLADGTTIEQPTILNVPLIFPASKKASMTFPIDVGDIVLCVFSQRSTDAFKASTGSDTYTPDDKRRFSIRDAIAIPGLFPFRDSINDPAKRKWTHSTRDMVITNNIGENTENEVRLKENGDIEMRTDQDFFAKFNNGVIECNNLTIESSGSFIINSDTVNVNATTTTIDSPLTLTSATTINAPLTVNALLSVVGGDVIADGISLKTHTHTDPQGGTVGPPL